MVPPLPFCERASIGLLVVQPEAVYALPELIPAAPGEPRLAADEGSHASHSNPPRVPLLPTDPEEATATYQWLHGLQLPQETIMGRPAAR